MVAGDATARKEGDDETFSKGAMIRKFFFLSIMVHHTHNYDIRGLKKVIKIGSRLNIIAKREVIIVYICVPIANYTVASSFFNQHQPTHHTI